ncbi:MAG: hypothetical protein HDR41_04055 [Lactobacillus sp.]|nr:hypothetical protein [Lactobacillus sp.]
MQITIDGTNYRLNFGIKFIQLMNDLHHTSQSGMNIGMGLNQATLSLMSQDVIGLAEIIECATWINPKRPTKDQIYAYLENDDTDITKLFKEIDKELKKSNVTKGTVKNLEKTIKAKQEQAMKMSSD